MNNQKTPTMLLLTPDEKFQAFGFTARDFYNDLDQVSTSKLEFDDIVLKKDRFTSENVCTSITIMANIFGSGLIGFSFSN